MNAARVRSLRPFISVTLIILTLFGVVFLQMEERRLGYTVLKLNRERKILVEQKRNREIALAKITRPQLLESMAHSKFTLQKVQADQIIHLSGEGQRSSQLKEL